MNFHPVKQLFRVTGARDRTADPWVTSPTLPPYTTGDSLLDFVTTEHFRLWQIEGSGTFG